MSKYELGEFNRVAYDHGQSVVQEMRNVTALKKDRDTLQARVRELEH